MILICCVLHAIIGSIPYLGYSDQLGCSICGTYIMAIYISAPVRPPVGNQQICEVIDQEHTEDHASVSDDI